MTDNELAKLIKDIVTIQQTDGFGSLFKVSLVKPEQFDELVVRVAYADTYIRARVVLDGYPARPNLIGYDEQFALSQTLVAEAQDELVALDRPVTLFDIVEWLSEVVNDHRAGLLEEEITQVQMPRTMYDEILAHYFEAFHPNEYAYVCSGTLKDGVAHIEAYYTGEMLHSTVVFSENTEEFNNRIVYEDIPHAHNLIVWGHVHPIEQPSWTDVSSFKHLAAWDRVVVERGVKDARSIALLISSNTKIPSFFDVHKMAQIPHQLKL